MAGLVFKSMEDYTIRFAASSPDDIEAATDKLFPASLLQVGEPQSCYRSNSRDIGTESGFGSSECQERQYADFVILQTIIDQALMWIRSSPGDEILGRIPRDSLLPTNKEEKCSSKLVCKFVNLMNSVNHLSLFQIIADRPMTHVPMGGSIDPVESILQSILFQIVPMFTVYSFAFSVPLVIMRIVEEKQQGVKELMKMMGLPNWLLWVGWFNITILTNILVISVAVMILVIGKIVEKANPFVLFVSLFLYGFSTICFLFAQSTLFSNRMSENFFMIP